MSTMYWLIAAAAAVLLALLGWRLRQPPLHGAGLLPESAGPDDKPMVSLPLPIFQGIDSLKPGDAAPKAANWWQRQG